MAVACISWRLTHQFIVDGDHKQVTLSGGDQRPGITERLLHRDETLNSTVTHVPLAVITPLNSCQHNHVNIHTQGLTSHETIGCKLSVDNVERNRSDVCRSW